MADQDDPRRPHFILSGMGRRERFRSAQQGGAEKRIPARDRVTHGQQLMGQLEALRPEFERVQEAAHAAGLDQSGLVIEFESFPDVELAVESLSREASGIELLNVRQFNDRTLATVYVPDGKLAIFENKVAAYLDETKDRKVPAHATLLNAIAAIRAGALEALWTDVRDQLPDDKDEAFWWEVWLPVNKDRDGTVRRFLDLAHGLGVRFGAPLAVADTSLDDAGGNISLDWRQRVAALEFQERTVILVHATRAQMARSSLVLSCVAEFRRAKETADFFDALPPAEQPEWVDELLQRTIFADPEDDSPRVCILDTGVNIGHRLLAPAIGANDLHTVDPAWGANDADGHGTEMAGLALFGDLTALMASEDPVVLDHRLESVKLIPSAATAGTDSYHHGSVTIEGVARPGIIAPERPRVFSLAVTAKDDRDSGRPSAWSSVLDELAADVGNDAATRRLIVVAAGNIKDPGDWLDYPDSNITDGVHDPGQSWNALTVGAYTTLVDITEADAQQYEPIAPDGCLSPFSTTSVTWPRPWPMKPDVVFEGGNAGRDPLSAATIRSLKLLTTNFEPAARLLTTSNATSAASALAARMAARLMARYPDLWPETIRALIVHSAEWTGAMRQAFLPAGRPTMTDMARLVRICGFGVPDLDRAMWSVDDSLSIICQDQLRPFERRSGGDPTLRDMNLHALPWPLDELRQLGEQLVEMRVTLSYFIEPNPSARGVGTRYRYESHGLRFDVRRPTESVDEFRVRINKAARDEGTSRSTATQDDGWTLGKQARHLGSLHSDIWRGTAAALADRGVLAIYPTMGWWKTRKQLERFDSTARYALVVSIRAPECDVDLYSAVEAQIETTVEVDV